MNFRQLIQRNKDMLTVFGALSEKVESVKKAFWMRLCESHHRPAVQHLGFVLLDAENNRVPYYTIPVVFRADITASSVADNAARHRL
jgi:hypothetical protein